MTAERNFIKRNMFIVAQGTANAKHKTYKILFNVLHR